MKTAHGLDLGALRAVAYREASGSYRPVTPTAGNGLIHLPLFTSDAQAEIVRTTLAARQGVNLEIVKFQSPDDWIQLIVGAQKNCSATLVSIDCASGPEAPYLGIQHVIDDIRELACQPPQLQRLPGVAAKIERAKRHIEELNVAIRAFFDSNPYAIFHQRDPKTRRPSYYVGKAKQTSIAIPILAGDAIHCLRSAMDHLAMQFAMSYGAAPNAKGVSFPIGPPAQDKSQIAGIVRGKGKPVVEAIHALEPYKGGAGHDFWMLHELDIIDKHRLLVTVGSYHQSVDVGPSLMGRFLREMGREDADVIAASMALPIRPADNLCPLKTGDKLFTDLPDAEIDEKLKFAFGVAIHEPGVAESKTIPDALIHLANRVENVVETLFTLL